MEIEIKTDLVLSPLDGGRLWELYKPFIIQVDDLEIEVPSGYITDFASIRYRILGLIVPRWGKHGFGTIVHDWLYESFNHHIVDRKTADQIFNEMMKYYKTKTLQRLLTYYSVRWFGWIAYKYTDK